jgi:hypothetical protein
MSFVPLVKESDRPDLSTAAIRRAVMDTHGIDTLAGLRDIYEPLPANSLATRIVFPQLHRHHRAFIARRSW